MANKKVMIDPGHGAKDPGAVGNGLEEANVVLDISKRVKKYLEANYSGITVYMTRESDKFLELSERADLANDKKVDLFVSNHINAGGGTGFESFIYNGGVGASTKKAQDDIHNAMIAVCKKYGMKDRGQKTANFAVIRETNMEAVLVENLFIDDKDDAKLLKDSGFKQALAEAEAQGIAKFLGLKKKTASKPAPAPKPATPKKDGLTAVIVDGKQVGAYGDINNALAQVEKYIKTAKKIVIEEA